MKILHILRHLDDERALTTALAHAQEQSASILLLQDAVLARVVDFPGSVYAGAEDVAARVAVVDYELVDYDQIVQLIFEHDKAITW